MRAIISAPGSRGDVNPMVAIGRQLRLAGFDVVVSVAEPYAPIVEAAGLTAEILISRDEFDKTLAAPEVWKPISGARILLRMIIDRFLRPHFEMIQRLHIPGQTVLVAHPLDTASRIFRDLQPSTPLASVHLAPAYLRTDHSPPRVTPWWFEVRRPASAVRLAYWLADRLGIDPIVTGPINRLRAEHQLPPVKRVLHKWWLSPDRIIAMYPRWYAPATAAYCPRLVHAGFPLEDLAETSENASTFDDRPFVFTGGTANQHCRDFFQRAADACDQLNHPGILLSTHAENFPTELPKRVRTESYVALGGLLPQCQAIVHHGGIGTTSQALAAGVPQIVRPMAYDQFDNATRVAALGCGVWLRTDGGLNQTLQQCIDGVFQSDCQDVASRFTGESGASVAAGHIQQMLEHS